jgi:hypothetical protein
LIGNPVPLSACKLVEQFTERVDHSTSDKKHDDPEHIIHMLLKVGYSLRSFPRLPHDGLEEKNNRNCCQNYAYQFIHRDPVDNRRRQERLKEAITGSVQQTSPFALGAAKTYRISRHRWGSNLIYSGTETPSLAARLDDPRQLRRHHRPPGHHRPPDSIPIG